MADKFKDMWLKVLISLLITLVLLSFGFTAGKVDKKAFERHEKYETEKFRSIKDFLDRHEKYQTEQLTDIKDTQKLILEKL